MFCENCGASILPGEQECPVCKTPLEQALSGQVCEFVKMSCSHCGHWPVVVPVGGWGDCPVCGKAHS